MAWPEDKALLGSNLSAEPGAKTEDHVGLCVGVASLFGIGTKATNPNNYIRFLTNSWINKKLDHSCSR